MLIAAQCGFEVTISSNLMLKITILVNFDLKWIGTNNFHRFLTCTSVCMCVYVYKHACLFVSVFMCQCLCTCVCLCVCMFECLCMCECGMPNITFVSLACMPNVPKSVKCENDICICLCVSVCACVCVYLYFCVCVCVTFINLVSLECMPNELKLQNVNF